MEGALAQLGWLLEGLYAIPMFKWKPGMAFVGVHLWQAESMEVYTDRTLVPGIFKDSMNPPCAVIAVWTMAGFGGDGVPRAR